MQVQFSSQSFYMQQTSFSYSSTRNNIAFENELYNIPLSNDDTSENSTENKTNDDPFSLESYRGKTQEEKMEILSDLREEHGSIRGMILYNAKVTASQFSDIGVQKTVLQVMGTMGYIESGSFAYDFQERTSNKTVDFKDGEFKEFVASLIQEQKDENVHREYPRGLNNMKIYNLLINKYDKNISSDENMIHQYSNNNQHNPYRNETDIINDPFSLNKYKNYANKTDDEKAQLLAELEQNYSPARSEIMLFARTNAARYDDPMVQKVVLDTLENKDLISQRQIFTASFTQITFSVHQQVSTDTNSTSEENKSKHGDIKAQKSHLDFLEQNTIELEAISFKGDFFMMISEAYKMVKEEKSNLTLTEDDFKDYDTDVLLELNYTHEQIAQYESFTAVSHDNQNGSSFYSNRQSFYAQSYSRYYQEIAKL